MTAIDAASAIVSDVDNTLLGDDGALRRFAAWYAQMGDGLRLIYASGRFYDSIVESIRTTALPDPDVIIGGVGTEVRQFPTGEPLGSWRERFEDRFDARAVVEALRGHPGVEMQPGDCCSEFKVSFFLRDAGPGELHEIRAVLAEASVDAELIYSSNRDLDVLPAGVNKGSAARHAIECLRVRRDRVIACGDSANDLSMFRHGFRGVVVSNAHAELRTLDSASTHQSDRPFADGVLDGIDRWSAEVPGLQSPTEREPALTTSR